MLGGTLHIAMFMLKQSLVLYTITDSVSL